jgi:hypothetical protein
MRFEAKISSEGSEEGVERGASLGVHQVCHPISLTEYILMEMLGEETVVKSCHKEAIAMETMVYSNVEQLKGTL